MIYLHQISAHLTLLRGIILKKNFDIILSNPPFSLKIPFDMEMHFCMYGKPPASNADFAFLQYCIFKKIMAGQRLSYLMAFFSEKA
ncbi:TPA: N-6 DNA methylase, partial [Salmonella enterica subsp. enterica]